MTLSLATEQFKIPAGIINKAKKKLVGVTRSRTELSYGRLLNILVPPLQAIFDFPEEGFAPLKNPSGASQDSPETVRQALNAYAIRHLEQAGIIVSSGAHVEIDTASVFDDEDIRLIATSGVFPKNRIDGPHIIRAI